MEFEYRARDLNGRVVRGVLEAPDEKHLHATLKKGGLYLVSAKVIKKGNPKKRKSLTFGKIRRKEVIAFTSHLATVISVGIPILQGLEDIARQTKNPKFRSIVEDIREKVRSGSSLSSALSRHPNVFSEIYINMVIAGEASGNLDNILKELTSFLEWQEELASNIKRASVYPAMVLTAVGILMTLLFAFAFPRITKILLGMKVPLPFITRALIAISSLFKDYWFFMFFLVALILFGIKFINKTEKGKLWIDWLKLRLPIFGDLIRKIAISRFAHQFSVLWQAGIDVPKSLTLVERVVGNKVIANAISRAREEVLEGKSLSEAFSESKEFPTLIVRMISLGEASGEMDTAMEKVSSYYDQEIPATIKKMFSVFEPMIIVVLAGIVLTVALSIYLPIYTAIGHIGK